ncbi:MAG: IS1595 family transposase [Lentisphaeraceae bacterium]|nr:IS1595 family transposase [Lentisphaeraceae bacterium]
MSKNKIQLQIGLSLIEFNELYLSEEACSQKVQGMRWPHGYRCDKCQSCNYWRFRRGHKDIFQCKDCKHQCSLTGGTIFEHTRLPLTTWFLAIQLISQSKNSISSLELHRQLKVNYKTAWLLKHKIMAVMFDAERQQKLVGRVEIDEAYLGGKLKSGGADCDSKNKTPFIAAVQTNKQGCPLYVKLTPVEEFSKKAISAWAEDNISKGAHFVTDGLAAFKVLKEFGTHEIHNIKQEGKVSTDSVFYWVNIVLGNVKSSLAGTFHCIKFHKYASRYLADVQFRFNRRFDLKKLFYSVIRQATLHRACPRSYLESVTNG